MSCIARTAQAPRSEKVQLPGKLLQKSTQLDTQISVDRLQDTFIRHGNDPRVNASNKRFIPTIVAHGGQISGTGRSGIIEGSLGVPASTKTATSSSQQVHNVFVRSPANQNTAVVQYILAVCSGALASIETMLFAFPTYGIIVIMVTIPIFRSDF